MKKTVSIILIALIVISACILPVSAATSLGTILEEYVLADVGYKNLFDTETKAAEFSGNWYNTAGDTIISGNSLDSFGWDESNQRFKVTRGQYDSIPDNSTVYSVNTEALTTTDTKLCLITFKAQVDTSMGYVQYRLSTNSPKNYQAMIQFASNGELRYRGSGSWQYISGGITAGSENTFAFLMNYNDNTFSLWVNKGTDLSTLTASNADVKDFAMSTTNRSYTGYFTMSANDNIKDVYGSMHLDDFKVTPLVVKTEEEPQPEEGDYSVADESLWNVEPFDNEAAAMGFGSWNKSNEKDTIGYDSINKRLKVTRGQYDADTANQTFYHKDITSITTMDSGLCLISFKAYVDSTIKYARYTLCDYNASSEQVRIQFDSQNQIRLYNGSTQYFSINAGEENTFTFLMNYKDHTFTFWLNKGSDLSTLTVENADAVDLAMGSTTNTYSRFLCMYVNDKVKDYYGSMYLDDFKVIPFVSNSQEEPEHQPEESDNIPAIGTLLYEETFDMYDEGTISAVAPELKRSGVAAVRTDYMSVKKDGNNNYLVIDDTASEWHTWYFNKDENFINKTKELEMENLVIQFDVKTDDAGYANLGSGSASNCILYYYTSSGINFDPRIKTTSIVGLSEFSTITFMIGNDNSISMWIGSEKVVHAYKSDTLSITSKVAGDLSKIDCLNFRPDGGDYKMLVDNIRVYEAKNDDFLKVDTVIRNIQSELDLSPETNDGIVSDLSAEVVLKGVDEADKVNYTVSFEDTKGYFNGNSLILPLVADTADVTVKVSYGEVSDAKCFSNITIPAAYSFSEIDWGKDIPIAGAKFDSAVIKAVARNQASDTSGRISIVAALCSQDGSEIIAANVQNDTLFENGEIADSFAVCLDLSNVSELPENPVVKVLVIPNGGSVKIAGEFTKEY